MAKRGANVMMWGLAAVVVALIGFIVVVAAQGVFSRSTPPTTVVKGGGGQEVYPGEKAPATNVGSGAAAADFDPKNATKVPKGMTPKTYVADYYQAILDESFDKAYKMLPAPVRGQSTADEFEAAQKGHRMISFKILGVDPMGSEQKVRIQQDLGKNGKLKSEWTFVQLEGVWVLKARMMVAE